MALHDVNAVVTITTNAVKAIDDGKKLKQIYADINEQLNKMRAEGKTDTSEFKQMQKLAEDTKAKINEMLRGMELIDKVMGDISGHIGKDLNRALRETSKEFNKTSSSTDEGKAKLEKLRDVVADLKRELSDRRGLTMSLKDAEAQLKNLNNASLDKLKQGLQAVQEEAAKTTSATTRERYQGYAKQYRAQIAVNELGVAGHADLSQMNTEQLRAEQKRLQSLYTATEGADGFFRISDDAINRLQAVNTELKKAIDEERQITELRSARKQTEEVMSKLNFDQAVSLKDLNTALKNYELQLKEVKGVDEDATRRIEEDMKRIKAARNELNTTYIRPMAQYPGNYSLEELQEASKAGKEQFARMKPDELGYNQLKRDIQEIDAAIEQMTPKWHELAQAQQKEAEASEIVIRAYRGEKVSLDELTIAEKALQEQVKKMEGVNLDPDDTMKLSQTKDKLQDIRELIDEISLDGLDFDSEDGLSTASVERLETALKNLEAQEKRLSGNQKAEAEEVARKKRMVQEQIQKCKQQTQDFANAEKVAGETGKHSVYELQQAYNTLQQKLMSLNTGQKKEIAEVRQQMKQVKTAIEDTTGAISRQGGIFKTAIKNITAYVGVFGAFNFIKSKLTEIVHGAAELSDQMANIRKVSGLAMTDIEDLTRTLAKMDTRTTLSELEQIAYRGAKLGFGNMGIEGLEEFTRAANQVNVALKEDLGEDALAALSKITENMGLIKKMGVEDAMLATGSAMFKLAASSTAAAGPIVEVTKRLVPVAQMSGFATHEILALASASDSLHLMPEVVGTALSKLMMAMQNNHNQIEKYLEIPEGTISSMFKAGDAMDALLLVFDKMAGKNVTQLDGLWKLLGSDGQRLITVVADMANHTDTLRTHLETSTKAFMEATAVTEEYNIQQETAQALFERASNIWRNAFINADSSLSVKEMAQSWYDFSKALLQSESSMRGVKLVLDLFLGSLRLLINLLPMISFGLLAKGATLLIDKLNLAKFATDGFTLSWKKMDAATKSNWIGLVVGGLVQLVFWIQQAATAAGEAEAQQLKMQDAMDQAAEEAEKEISAMSRLKGQIENTALAQEERNKLFSKFKSDYDIYLNYLGIELKTVDDLAKHYDALTKVMKQRFAYQEREEYKRDQMGGNEGSRMKRRNAGSALLKKAKEANQNIDLDIINSLIDSGLTPAEVSIQLLGRRPNVQQTTPTDKLRDALIHYAQARTNEIKEENDINAAFAAEIGDFDYDKWLRSQVKGDFVVEPPKGGGGGGNKQLRADLKAAEQQARAIIDNIKNYYQRQINAVNEMANDADITEGDLQGRIDRLKEHMNEALTNARKKIGGEKNDWEEFKTNMREDLWEQTDEEGYNFSENLLNKVMDNELDKLRDMIMTLSKALNRDGNVLLDQILRKATESEGKNIKMATQQRKALLKEMLEKNYTGKVDLETMSMMERFGIGGITNRQGTQLQAWKQGGTPEDMESAKKFFENRERGWMWAFENARENIVEIINSPIEKEGDQDRLLKILFGSNYKEALDGSAIEGFLSMSLDQWKVFYIKLMDYTDQWTDAQKKAYDEVKKRQDYLFNNRADVLAIDSTTDLLTQASAEQNRFGETASFGRQMGVVDTIQNDPELMRLELLQARAEMYYNKMSELRAQDLISEEQLKDAKDQMTQAQLNMQNKLVDAMQSRATAIQNAIEPVTQFAEDAGQKLGDMMFNMESQSMTWDQIWKKMVLAMAKSVIQMGQQYLVQKIQRQMFNAQVEADETTHQSILTAIALGGALARMEGELTIDQGRLIQKKVVNGEEVAEEVSLATILTALGISEGAAKTIGSLGWWGIPLVAVISALLMGLLSSALSTAGAESSKSTAATKKVKLASGMLTYDEGNVRTVVGDDGRVYRAREQRSLPEGVSMVTEPIATRVNGQQALVGERGPEIVIGRRTTRAIQMNRPDLLRDLALIDRGITTRKVRTFDEGNLSDLASAIRPTDASTESAANDGSQTIDAATAEALRQMPAAMAAFAQVMTVIQKQGIPAKINKYGTGGLIDEVQSGLKFVSKYK